MAQHKAAMAAGRLEDLLQMVGHLRGRSSDCPLVASGKEPAVVEEFLAGQLSLRTEPCHQFPNKPGRGCLAGNDLAMEVAKGEPLRQCRKIISGIVRKIDP